MHEFSVVRGLLNQVDHIAEQQRAKQITAVRVSVGEFSGVDADLLQFAFEQLAPNSSARGASLAVRRVRLQACCSGCDQVFDVENFRFVCPDCQEVDVAVVGGDGLVLDSVTVEANQ
jgi:hydrogenase nickel incorporation protein HypA/HybF